MENTSLSTVTQRFIDNPVSMNAGSGKLARRYSTSREIIIEAKRLARAQLNNLHTQVSEIVEDLKSKIICSETNHNTGDSTFTLSSSTPLSPKEIEELVGVDNITTFVDRSWLKSHKNGSWTYSVLTVCKVKDFYNAKELDVKLKEIFENNNFYKTNLTGKGFQGSFFTKDQLKNPKALFVYIADDHAGLVLKDSLYSKEYSQGTYTKRLLQIVQEVRNLNEVFDEMYIIRLGDEMDGYNGKTTRYDHDLGSLSNKEQFDMYTTSNKLFYDAIFTSNKALNYNLISLSNSNHTGKGFSYIANKALEFWLEAKYPNVKVSQQNKFIDVIVYGNHLIGLTHGKDEQHMKSPMPLNLDYKTDLWLMEYYRQFNLPNAFISTIKGDIHKYNINIGKSGRYINVPSIASASNWIEHNFGDSKAGALLEIYDKTSPNVSSYPIWFD